MASARGKLPFTHRLELKTNTPAYHHPDICGSNLHGLAQTVQAKLQKGSFDEALTQIQRCIDARLGEMRRRSNPDPAHNRIVQQLRNFKSLVRRLQTSVSKGDIRQDKLFQTTIVRYVERSEPHHFEILIGSLGSEQILRGGRRRKSRKSHKRTRRSKTRRSKTRRGKTHRSKTRRSKTRRSKTRRTRRH